MKNTCTISCDYIFIIIASQKNPCLSSDLNLDQIIIIKFYWLSDRLISAYGLLETNMERYVIVVILVIVFILLVVFYKKKKWLLVFNF